MSHSEESTSTTISHGASVTPSTQSADTSTTPVDIDLQSITDQLACTSLRERLDRRCTLFVRIGRQTFKVLLDSGAKLSVLRQDVFNAIMAKGDLSWTPEIKPLSRPLRIRTALGHIQEVPGQTLLPLQFGATAETVDSSIYIQRFAVVPDLVYPIILGRDFLREAGCVLNWPDGTVQIRLLGAEYEILTPTKLPASYRPLQLPVVYTGSETTVPSGTEMVLKCRVGSRSRTCSHTSGIFEPAPTLVRQTRLSAACGVMEVGQDGLAKVLVINGDVPNRRIKRGTILGRWTEQGDYSTKGMIRPRAPSSTDDTDDTEPEQADAASCEATEVPPTDSSSPVPDRGQQPSKDKLSIPEDGLILNPVVGETSPLAQLDLYYEHEPDLRYEDGLMFDVMAYSVDEDVEPKGPGPPNGNGECNTSTEFEWKGNNSSQQDTEDPKDYDPPPDSEAANKVQKMSPEELKAVQLEMADSVDLSDSILNEAQKEELRTKVLRAKYKAWAVDNLNPHRCNVMEFEIPTGDAKPVQSRPYRVSLKENEYINEHVKKMLDSGIIRMSQSQWSSPVVLVPKPDGSLRFCVDYRKLNSLLPDDQRPLPLIQDVIDALKGAKYFSCLDLASAYWSLPIKEGDKLKTAFVTKEGLFEFNVMPFGIKSAPTTFQYLMGLVLLGHPTARAYQDDVSVVSLTWEQHIEDLRDLFDRLIDAGLSLKASKCKFCMKEMPYLGFLVGPDGVRPNPEKIAAIKEMAVPQKKKMLRAFLGLAQYYRKFVLGFSQIASPLYDLLKLNATYDWRGEHQEAFEVLRDRLCDTPVLAYPDPNLPFILYTDASDVGVGAVLSQVQDGTERVVQYLSRKLNDAERRYGASEKECLAVVWAIEKCRPYLWGRHFEVVTDCVALRWLMTTASPNGRLIRWSIRLSEYSFTVKYRKGSSNANADALSRIFKGQGLVERYEEDNTLIAAMGDERVKSDGDDDLHVSPQTYTTSSIPFIVDPSELVPRLSTFDVGGNLYEINAILLDPQEMMDSDPASYVIEVLAIDPQEVEEESKQSESPQLSTEESSTKRPWLDEDEESTEVGTTVEEDLHDEVDVSLADDPVLQHLKRLQEEDEDLCLPFIKVANGDPLPDGDDSISSLVRKYHTMYHLDDEGRLVYRKTPNAPVRLVVPEGVRKQLLYAHHNSPTGGHLGRGKTYERMLSRYWWPGMYTDTCDWIATCSFCNRRKPSPYGRVGQLHPLNCKEPFGMLGMDLMGPLPETSKGNRYVMVVTDYLTRWVEAFPLKAKKAITIASILYREIFARYGAPSSILTDQGKEFNNGLLSALCLSYGIKKLMATTKKSSTNGLVERFNRTLIGMLAIQANLDHATWDDHLHSCLYAYRASRQESTGKSPYELLFGTKMKMPIDVATAGDSVQALLKARDKVKEDLGSEFVDLETQALTEVRTLTREIAREQAQRQLNIQQDVMRQRWLKVARQYNVDIGSQVYIKSLRGNTNAKAKKMRFDWTGPYEVIDLRERGNLLLREVGKPNAITEVWHITKVKPVKVSSRLRRRGIQELADAPAGLAALFLEPRLKPCP